MSTRMESAEEGNRTPKPLRAEDFESSASASSATSARRGESLACCRDLGQPALILGEGDTMMEHRHAHGSAEAESTETLVNLNARVPRHLWRRVRLQCLHDERLLRTFITEALREYLHGHAPRSGG